MAQIKFAHKSTKKQWNKAACFLEFLVHLQVQHTNRDMLKLFFNNIDLILTTLETNRNNARIR